MIKLALWVYLEAKPGKEKELELFLQKGLPVVQEETGTMTWYAIRLGASKYGIFDTFANEASRQAHLSGALANALKARAEELLSKPPAIEKIEILAAKIHEEK